MEYQKIAHLLDNASNQLSKFRTKNWVEINDESRGGYTTSSDSKFTATMLRSSLCDFAYACILFNRTITFTRGGDDVVAGRAEERNKGVIFKNCASFTKSISKIDDTGIDNAQGIDIVMPMYNLIKYSDIYSNLGDSESFKSKVKLTGSTPAGDNTKDVKIIVPLNNLHNFWRTLEMLLINFEVKFFLTWSSTYGVITNSTGEGRFTITGTKPSAPVVTLSTQDNTKLLQQLKSGFRRRINWNKYHSDPYAQNRFSNHLVNPSFQ